MKCFIVLVHKNEYDKEMSQVQYNTNGLFANQCACHEQNNQHNDLIQWRLK